MIDNQFTGAKMKIAIQQGCPFCHNLTARRKRRKAWMRLLPKSKLYICSGCRNLFLLFLWFSVGFRNKNKFNDLTKKVNS